MKKIVIALLSALLLLFVYSCKDTGEKESTTVGEKEEKLTLETVCKLSEKGENLTWEDFEEYDYIETGSGLYIRAYDIDNNYRLMIGGGHPDSPPMYIYLICRKTAYQKIDIRYDDVKSFIAESSEIKEGTKRFTARVVQNGEAIAPAGKSEFGMTLQTGELILSVEDCGNTELENGDLCSIKTDELTQDTKLPRLIVGDAVRIELDENSEITTYSFDPTVMISKAVSVQRCNELGDIIIPLEELDVERYGYSINDARRDKGVYFRDFDVVFGKEYFESFLANIKYGSCSSVRLASYYTESDSTYVTDLYYNGKEFTIRELFEGEEILQTYKYLRQFITDVTEDSARLVYILTLDEEVTYDKLLKGLYSSRFGDFIPHRQVYTQYGFMKDGVFFDNSQRGKDNPKPEPLYKNE